MLLKGQALFAAATLMAAVGFLLFGYDQVWIIAKVSEKN